MVAVSVSRTNPSPLGHPASVSTFPGCGKPPPFQPCRRQGPQPTPIAAPSTPGDTPWPTRASTTAATSAHPRPFPGSLAPPPTAAPPHGLASVLGRPAEPPAAAGGRPCLLHGRAWRARARRVRSVPTAGSTFPGRGKPPPAHPRRSPAPWTSEQPPTVVAVRARKETSTVSIRSVSSFLPFRFFSLPLYAAQQKQQLVAISAHPDAGAGVRSARHAGGPAAARAVFFRGSLFLFPAGRYSNGNIF